MFKETYHYQRKSLLSPVAHCIIQLSIVIFLCVYSCVTTHHLRLEKEWSAEQQRTIDMDTRIIASQSKYITALENSINKYIQNILEDN